MARKRFPTKRPTNLRKGHARPRPNDGAVRPADAQTGGDSAHSGPAQHRERGGRAGAADGRVLLASERTCGAVFRRAEQNKRRRQARRGLRQCVDHQHFSGGFKQHFVRAECVPAVHPNSTDRCCVDNHPNCVLLFTGSRSKTKRFIL
uniref:(northern house mosquito) hypothetical protein n=1 Tax=Culex pipiens TaxID=7175 RepID=A0A8D8NLL1_CULPI